MWQVQARLERTQEVLAIMSARPRNVNERNVVQTLAMAIIESIPNVSEGRRPDVVERFADAIRRTNGVRLLDYSSDASHNRSVFTLVGDAPSLKAATMALFEAAVPAIDLRSHQGEHPRLGAVDVVPFVPIEAVTMAECVALANEVAADVAARFGVPVFLYEEASANPLRRNLEDIRRGEFEGLAAKMASPGWTPDFGPARPHPSAGASVIGARMPLIAYNINLNTDRLDVAKKIAAAIRHSSGGLRYVKAMGVKVDDRNLAQVSMNLTHHEKTPIFRVFEMVKREAERYGVAILESEIVGLVPSAALVSAAQFYLQLERFGDTQILEHKLRLTTDD
jgi:glutamate formiminotransferase / 5-formyltetrahydrofolate cyclo-ligase